MREHIDSPGFMVPTDRACGHKRRGAAWAELVAIVGLALSTIVAATVVSVGIARAGVADSAIDNDGNVFAVALLLGVIFLAIGGFSALSLPFHWPKKH